MEGELYMYIPGFIRRLFKTYLRAEGSAKVSPTHKVEVIS